MAVRELSPEQALQHLRDGALLIDVREPHERAAGMADGARGIESQRLLADPHAQLPHLQAPVVLICQSGKRSLLAAEALALAGFEDVASITGGTTRWQAEGWPMQAGDATGIDQDFAQRYSRHLLLPQVGPQGQQRMQAAHVAVIGAGGLGSPVAFYLAAAGVGHLRLIDHDTVDRSNLQRQILHTDAAVGQPKVASAASRLGALNPRIRIEAVAEKLTSANVETLLHDMDVVIDGGDNFPVRYLLNDACVHLRKPLVYGAVHRFEGQLSVFDAGRRRGEAPCYRCLFPAPPPPEHAPNCAEAGVLGVLPGVIGMLQATEALKLLLGIGEPLLGRLLQFDALGMRFRELRLPPDPQCPVCAPGRAFPGYIDYAAFCGATPHP